VGSLEFSGGGGPGMSALEHVGRGSLDQVLPFRRSGATGALRAVRHTAGSHGAPHGATGDARAERSCLCVARLAYHTKLLATAARLVRCAKHVATSSCRCRSPRLNLS
jgi:hypothetical protein